MEKDRKSESDKHAGKLSMPPDVPPLGIEELYRWSLYRALLAEFTATLLFVYIIVATVIGYKQTIVADSDHCAGVGVLGIAWAVGGAIFVLVYSFAGISGGHINPAVTLGLVMARRVSLIRAILYILAQCAGAICGAGVGRAIYGADFVRLGGAANVVAPGFTLSQGFVTEMIATLFLVLTVLVASDSNGPKRGAHIPILAPLPIGFAVFVAHLLAIPVTGTGINPARSLGSAVILNDHNVWNDQWIFWVGPFVGAVLAAIVYLVIFEADLEVRRWKDTTSNADYHSEKNPLYL